MADNDKEHDTAEFESEYVHKFYSKKSEPFSDSRVKPWPFTLLFMEKYSSPSSIVLDAGCGNGRQFISENTIGLDFSANLLLQARKKSPLGLVRGDIHILPFRDRSFDICLSIAVVHHLSTHERRVGCLREMMRVMKDDGMGLVYAWHRDASTKKKFTHIKGNDYFVSWKGESDALRYYHLFDQQSLVKLCEEAGFGVLESGIEQESVYTVVAKNK